MMATASGNFSEAREKNLPPLSPTIEASQLLTPLQLGRITIDDPHYHDHLMHSLLLQHQTMGTSVPSHQHVLNRRTAKLGDNFFFLQKDIPVSQAYARTALKLSDVRPWDQIVDRPLNSQKVIDKEVHLPFPQEHPYTSHISRFAVFPDTNYRPPPPVHEEDKQQFQESIKESNAPPATQDTLLPRSASVQTQTTLSSFKPLPAYYVPQKAGEWGLRVEEHHLSVPGIVSLNPDVGRTFWDLPRSRQHRRANTYPAPRFLYSTQLPDTPGQLHTTTTTQTGSPPSPTAAAPTIPHVPPPPLSSSSTQGSPPITPRTSNALSTIHKLLTRTTTYAEHFPGQRVQPSGHQNNILRLDYSLRSCVSQRPWTSESRGKYCRRIPMSPRMDVSDDVSEAESDALGDSDGVVFSLLKGVESCSGGAETHREVGSHGDGNVKSQKYDPISFKDTTTTDLVKIKGQGGSNLVDSWTQTEDKYFSDAACTTNAPLPQLSYTTLSTTTQFQASQSSQPQAQITYKLPQVETTQPAKKVTIPSLKESSGVQPSQRLLEASKLNKMDTSQLVRFPSAKRPLSAFIDSIPVYNKSQHTRSYSADASYTPHIRTAQATRRLMGLYNGFNRTEVMRRFHEQYPEKAPDLREYSVREGKRHIICGSNAYYFH